jgi:hypothetical protein
MAEGLATATANSILDAILNATSYSVATPFIKLHVGAPGAAGTSNPATETTRKAVSCSAAASGAITSDADIVWTNVAGSEDYTHWSIWTASTAGTFVCSGTMTANAVVAADTFTIPAGDLDLSFTVAS